MGHESGAVSAVTGEIGDIPRRPLSFGVTRRELFRSLRPDGEQRKPARDVPAYSLKALGTFTDEELATITPALVPGCRLSVSEGMVLGWAPADEAPRRLFAAERTNLRILDAIDGRACLGAIAGQVREETDLSEHSFACVRALFLELVLARIAAPR